MRIAFFTDTHPPTMDGVVRAMGQFGRELEREGHEVKMFAPAPAGRANRSAGAVYAPSVRFPPYPQYRAAVWTGALVRAAARWKPDVIHCHAMLPMALAAREAAKKSGAPLVGTFHTLLPSAMHYLTRVEGLQKWGERLAWDYLRWLYGPFDVVTAPSRYMQKELAGQGIRAEVVPNGVDTNHFRPGRVGKEVREMVRGKRAGAVLLYLGRVAREKNLDFLFSMVESAAWKEWGARLVVAGDGPYKKEMRKRVEDRGLKSVVSFLGRVEDRHLPQVYRAADGCVLPSKFETQGLVAVEALACGTPVAALRGTALADVVREGVNGALMEEEAEAAVRAVQRMVRRRARLSGGARDSALGYGLKPCTARLLRTYREAIRIRRRKNGQG